MRASSCDGPSLCAIGGPGLVWGELVGRPMPELSTSRPTGAAKAKGKTRLMSGTPGPQVSLSRPLLWQTMSVCPRQLPTPVFHASLVSGPRPVAAARGRQVAEGPAHIRPVESCRPRSSRVMCRLHTHPCLRCDACGTDYQRRQGGCCYALLASKDSCARDRPVSTTTPPPLLTDMLFPGSSTPSRPSRVWLNCCLMSPFSFPSCRVLACVGPRLERTLFQSRGWSVPLSTFFPRLQAPFGLPCLE